MRRKTYLNDRTKRMQENPEKEEELRKAKNAQLRSQRAASKALERVQKLVEVADKVQKNMKTCIVKDSENESGNMEDQSVLVLVGSSLSGILHTPASHAEDKLHSHAEDTL